MTGPQRDTVLDLMQAIRAAHPGAHVEITLRTDDEDGKDWASVRVSGLPELDQLHRWGSYPFCSHASGDSLSVNRYSDGDVVGALLTALDIITNHFPSSAKVGKTPLALVVSE